MPPDVAQHKISELDREFRRDRVRKKDLPIAPESSRVDDADEGLIIDPGDEPSLGSGRPGKESDNIASLGSRSLMSCVLIS